MNWADILVLTFTIILMLSILFFSFIFPHIKNKGSHCASCPVNKDKKIKRAFKDYHKKNK